MPVSIFVFGFLILLFFLFLKNEKRKHDLAFQKIPIRIHVNGTRGKSSVTRLIHSILTEEGWNVFAKTTGSAPSLLFPDRSERRIFRNKISIGEQRSFLRFASNNDAQAVILECMAVQPRYQKDSEDILISATHTILTNVRPDHGEWTKSEEEILEGFSGTVPKEGTLFLGKSIVNSSADKYFEEVARRRKTKIINAESYGTSMPNEETKPSSDFIEAALRSIRYPEHRENVEIAVCICKTLGVTETSILSGIRKTVPDPGALTITETNLDGKRQRFVFAFAANDTVSWDSILKENITIEDEKKQGFDSAIVVFNSKRERPIRTIEFAKFLGKSDVFSKIYFFGAWEKLFRSFYKGNAELIVCKNDFRFDLQKPKLGSHLWIGAGNYQGPGRTRLLEFAEGLQTSHG
ncbi:poly-gamma-glutamate synthase PgsB [Leptospira barantonii]|uniref:Poly-gamma-glutamate synthase PgsB n=1 Tax=Leptospira barantonii TaxID=2023184 RepID=A0A5F2BP08_9LEPT|nr:poly-gamma-glutamate synthase PgsB [Leptospira barantonii]TGM07242.1 poly-gamma-glutamate synthase PgsB [Leptospira barantonii]